MLSIPSLSMGVCNEIILWISVIICQREKSMEYFVLPSSIRNVSVLASNINVLPRPDITILPTEFFLSSSVALEF